MPERGAECPGGWPGPRHADGPLDPQNKPPEPWDVKSTDPVWGGGEWEGLLEMSRSCLTGEDPENAGAGGALGSAHGREGVPGAPPPSVLGEGGCRPILHSFPTVLPPVHPCALLSGGCQLHGGGLGCRALGPQTSTQQRPPPPSPGAALSASVPITQDPGTIPTGTLRGGRGWKGILQALPDGPPWCGGTDPRGSRRFPWQPLLPRCVDGPGMPTPEREAAAWSWGSQQCGHHPGNCTPLASEGLPVGGLASM